ncbi:MAG TPA: cytochrome P450 [Acidimicrobiales bacterium]|nr:cytochrome P450 [Acidimicrobiales bacterium]
MTDVAPVFFNPLDPEYLLDPYPTLTELREREPIHHSPLGIWMLFGYQDVFELLRNPHTSVSDANIQGGLNEMRQAMFAELLEEFGGDDRERGDKAILNLDPPDHTRIRKLVSKAFTVRRVEALRPRIQELVDEVLDRVAGTGTWDVVEELAFPLPFQVISELLGMPEGDRAAIRDWSHALTKTLDPIISEEEMRAAFVASDAMTEYLEEVVPWKRANPADDVLTGLVQAEEDGDTLSAAELRDQIVLLFLAGHETTVNLIGNGLQALMRHPDQLRRWADDPGLDATAVDECLRYDAPVQLSRRIAMADLTLGEETVGPGTLVMTHLASANRDPAKWGPTADQLDIGRPDAGQHVSFGSGIHFCLGAALARLEGQVAMGSVIRRFPDLELAGEPVSNGRITLRGLDSLPVRG